jgi:hypothetical protein
MPKFIIRSLVLFFGASSFFFTGCEKDALSNSSDSNGATNHANPQPENAVHIVATFDFSTFPNVAGTFTTSGALGDQTGTATMDIGPLTPTGLVAHCTVVLTFSDGTISIKQECEFANGQVYPNNKGQWQITGGTGAYAGVKGNGITTMPPFQEDMTGVIQ